MNRVNSAHPHQIAPKPHSTFDCLIARIFDYAGMFPPAQRDFEAALRESASLASSLRRPWLRASDLVLDTAHTRRITEVALEHFGFHSPLSICVLATESFEQVSSALQALSTIPLPITVSSLEVKTLSEPPHNIISSWEPLASSCGALLAIEPDLSQENWQSTLDTCLEAISKASARVALKCRLTGPTGIGAEKLAAAICKASDLGAHLKVTGGLHHPVVDPSSHPYPMGFVNVTAAVMLRRALGAAISEFSIATLLTNSSWDSFSWVDEMRFENHSISLAQLTAAKESAHFSIGSCSLHEPDDDIAQEDAKARRLN